MTDTPPPPPPRMTTAIVALIAGAVGVVSFFPWRLETCDPLFEVASVFCEHTRYPAPVDGFGVVTVIALGVVAMLGVYATWRPTRSTWRVCGWAALVTGVAAFAAIGFDRHKATLDATSPGWAAALFQGASLTLACSGVALMAMGRHLASERLPHARARG